MKPIFLINGPNLNLLGQRDKAIYGSATLANIVTQVTQKAKDYSHTISAIQSNHEGELIDAIHKAKDSASGLIINAGAYSHTSIAIRDALECLTIPKIEVHLSNIYSREEFRRHSVLSEVVNGVICGLGVESYLLALQAIASILKK